ncbi:hypothetical protein UlMin_042429 [Ulmus minor]
MEDPIEEWEIVECPSPEHKQVDKVRWIFNKGLGLGKKMLVTGFVISSVPVILPPLVVISAIGLAVSVPSGVVLASHACADKLMSMLLPKPSPPLFEEGVGTKAPRKFGDGDENVDENGYEEEEEEPLFGESLDKDLVIKIEGVVLDDDVEEAVKETRDLLEEIRNEGKYDVKDDMRLEKLEGGEEDEEKNIVVEVTIEDEDADVDVEKEGEEKKTDESSLNRDKETARNARKDDRDDHKVADTMKLQETKKSKDAQSSSEKNIAIPSNEEKKKKNKKKQQQKVLYDEKKIWEEIEAVRVIVGYKATSQKTCMEQLKALYIFTGVEPPVSTLDSSDLAKLDHHLQFLKSIIGVK